MSEWSSAVQFCIKRATGRTDKGAAAGRAGILGLPNPHTGETAERCYTAAKKARDAIQASRQRHNKSLIPDGSTGNNEWDRALGVAKQSAPVARVMKQDARGRPVAVPV